VAELLSCAAQEAVQSALATRLSNRRCRGLWQERRQPFELHRHAGWDGGSLQRHRGKLVALRAPQCPLRATLITWSANGWQQRISGRRAGSASMAVPSCASLTTRSAPNRRNLKAFVTRRDFSDFAAIAPASTTSEEQVKLLTRRNQRHGRVGT